MRDCIDRRSAVWTEIVNQRLRMHQIEHRFLRQRGQAVVKRIKIVAVNSGQIKRFLEFAVKILLGLNIAAFDCDCHDDSSP